jgi:hypothetical protein
MEMMFELGGGKECGDRMVKSGKVEGEVDILVFIGMGRVRTRWST